MADAFAWRPTPEIVERSNLKAFLDRCGAADVEALNRRADRDPDWFWDAVLKFGDVRFAKPYDKVRDVSRGLPWTRWCVGGTTNLVLNTLDKHRGTPTMDKPAIVWESEAGAVRAWTYAELDAESCRLAAALRQLGVGEGDVVAIYLPLLPHTVAAFYAVARLGAFTMPLFSGFGRDAIALRLTEGGAKAAITCDATLRRGKAVGMKAELDAALVRAPAVRHVVVVRNLGADAPMQAGRDVWWDEATAGQPDRAPTVMVDSEHTLLLLFTSGTSGKPKGVVVPHCAVLGKMTTDLNLCVDLKPSDRFMWFTDFGWAVGPYCTAAVGMQGATLVLGEGAPDWPDDARMWRMVEQHRVSVLGTAPTAVRSQMRHGLEPLSRYDLSSLRVTMSGGEPWTEEAWMWFFEHVGKRRLPMLNWSGGTEIGGGILFGTLLQPVKPCAFTCCIPGMQADIVDEKGRSAGPGEVGELVLRGPSIGLTRSLWNADEQYIETYWSDYPDMWRHGDLAVRDADGQWWLTGRSDDTLKISGKRTGPSEIEGLLNGTGKVSESAAIGLSDPVTGQAVCCVCVPAPGVAPGPDLVETLAEAVSRGLGRSFRPKRIIFVDDLPKNNSGKIVRRSVRAVVAGESPGDLSTMVNPEAIEALKAALAAEADRS
jgi:acetyl-CoA synthetase